MYNIVRRDFRNPVSYRSPQSSNSNFPVSHFCQFWSAVSTFFVTMFSCLHIFMPSPSHNRFIYVRNNMTTFIQQIINNEQISQIMEPKVRQ
jgi:hypothetical protein